MQCAHVSDVVRDNKLMIVGVTLLAKPASTLAFIKKIVSVCSLSLRLWLDSTFVLHCFHFEIPMS